VSKSVKELDHLLVIISIIIVK